MPEQLRRAASSGDVAVFYLIAGLSPPNASRVAGFAIDRRGSGTRDETIRILNAASKPIFCTARLVGLSLEITTEPITDPDALRTRRQYLQLASQDLAGLAGLPAWKESELLLESEHEAMAVSTAVLRRFYEEYDIPHSSCQTQPDLGAPGLFAAIVRVGAAGSMELYVEDESTGEGEDE